VRAHRHWRTFDDASLDSSGVSFVVRHSSGTRVTSSWSDPATREIIPWSDVESLELPNPRAHPGRELAVSLLVSLAADFAIPRRDRPVGQTLAISAGVTAGSWLATAAILGGLQPDWIGAYPDFAPYEAKLRSSPASQTPVSSTLPLGDLWVKVPAAFTDLFCASNVPAPLIS